jgi:hypothetical protein
LNRQFWSETDCSEVLQYRHGKKAFTIPAESAGGFCIGPAARSMAAMRRARP